MRVILNAKHEAHAPPGEIENGAVIPCYECPARITAIRGALDAAGRDLTPQPPSLRGKGEEESAGLSPSRFRGGVGEGFFVFEEPPACSEAALATVHDPGYIDYIRETAAEIRRARGSTPKVQWPTVFPYGLHPKAGGNRALRGQYCFDTYTPILGATFAAALAGASAALHAAELVASGTERHVYVLTRPPGHHAERARSGGYCYFNNAALAAERLSKSGRVAILDLDVHHGNGAQHIFYERADVLSVSVHGDPAGLYPFFSGYAEETGSGAGLGLNLNVPLPPGTGVKEYRPALATAIDAVQKFAPAFLVLPFGTDAHETDPIGGFKLPTGYFREMGAAVQELGLPTIVTQEGGYNLDVIGACVVEFLTGLRLEQPQTA